MFEREHRLLQHGRKVSKETSSQASKIRVQGRTRTCEKVCALKALIASSELTRLDAPSFVLQESAGSAASEKTQVY